MSEECQTAGEGGRVRGETEEDECNQICSRDSGDLFFSLTY